VTCIRTFPVVGRSLESGSHVLAMIGKVRGPIGGKLPSVTEARFPPPWTPLHPKSRVPGQFLTGNAAFQVQRHEGVVSYIALTAETTFVSESLASPNSSDVFGSNSNSFSIPAKPGRIERLRKTTWAALPTCRIGIP